MKNLSIIAEVKNRDEEISYLVIEYDENDSKGYFLFGYRELSLPCEFDMWFPDLKKAKNQALIDYNVKDYEWSDYSQ